MLLLAVVSALDIKKMLDKVWIDRIYESEYIVGNNETFIEIYLNQNYKAYYIKAYFRECLKC